MLLQRYDFIKSQEAGIKSQETLNKTLDSWFLYPDSKNLHSKPKVHDVAILYHIGFALNR